MSRPAFPFQFRFCNNKKLFASILACIYLIFFAACENQEQQVEKQNTVAVTTVNPVEKQEQNESKVVIENKSYLFNLTNHSISELEALLERAEEVTMAQSPEYQDLEIVMVIHGPDIEWFKQQNYAENQKLIELAARLDAYDIIDMKVCERTMSRYGVEREDIPKFIDSVPFAPIEIQDRLNDGYINL